MNNLSIAELVEDLDNFMTRDFYGTLKPWEERQMELWFEELDSRMLEVVHECDLCPLSSPNLDCGGTGRDSLPF